ncbi:Putative N-ethylmaleimide reductase [Rhizopus microsporus]|nr:Putative N-ethylmaleimide reductase [Rhizopus microsporus]
MTITTLFSPVKLGRYQLEHRIVMAPTGRFRCTIEGVPTELVAEYYRQRASPGGLLITEATAIHESAGPYPYVAGIFTKEQIEGYKLATEAVHKKGGLFFAQLWHGGRATANAFMPNGEQIVSASDIPVAGKNPFLGNADYEVPRPLTKSEIKDVIQLYKQAALNAIEAGFDGVELHGANGYLIDQFINSNSNNRTDEYGGSIENRARFALEVVDAVAEAIGEDRTAIRFSPGGSFNGVRDDTVVETWSYLTSQLQKNHPNLAYIHFIERRYDIDADVDSISGDSLEPFRKIWKGTFIASGGFSTAREKAFEYAQQHDVLISFGRAFIANPDLPERLRNNWPLNPYHRPTFYTHDAVGYTDYPFYNAKAQA